MPLFANAALEMHSSWVSVVIHSHAEQNTKLGHGQCAEFPCFQSGDNGAKALTRQQSLIADDQGNSGGRLGGTHSIPLWPSVYSGDEVATPRMPSQAERLHHRASVPLGTDKRSRFQTPFIHSDVQLLILELANLKFSSHTSQNEALRCTHRKEGAGAVPI